MPAKLKIKLDVFKNVMVKNSLMVLVFVISYLALTAVYKKRIESFAGEVQPLQCKFDPLTYAKFNPDLAVFKGDVDALTNHYLTHGINEGRSPCGTCKYSGKSYLDANPDLRPAGVDDDTKALNHYNSYGLKEGRPICITNQPAPTASLPSDIDKVMGYSGNTHDNPPGVTNQTEESCRQLALKDPKYVAWGYRTSEHPDPVWRNTCFLYTGFGPFAGNTSDKAHVTGCLRPGEKVALGCKVPTTATSSPSVVAPPSTPACKRPDGWCGHAGSTYKNGDCIGDGVQGDHICYDTAGNRGTILRSNGCSSVWPDAPIDACPKIGFPRTAAPVPAPVPAPVATPIAAPVPAPVATPIAAPIASPVPAPAPVPAPIPVSVATPIAAPAPISPSPSIASSLVVAPSPIASSPSIVASPVVAPKAPETPTFTPLQGVIASAPSFTSFSPQPWTGVVAKDDDVKPSPSVQASSPSTTSTETKTNVLESTDIIPSEWQETLKKYVDMVKAYVSIKMLLIIVASLIVLSVVVAALGAFVRSRGMSANASYAA